MDSERGGAPAAQVSESPRFLGEEQGAGGPSPRRSGGGQAGYRGPGDRQARDLAEERVARERRRAGELRRRERPEERLTAASAALARAAYRAASFVSAAKSSAPSRKTGKPASAAASSDHGLLVTM
jgi:hypothetical protein